MSALAGAARMLRWPSARGPNSQRPSIQPTMRPVASSSATRSIEGAIVGRELDVEAVLARDPRELAPRRPGTPRTDDRARRDPASGSGSGRRRARPRARSRRRRAPAARRRARTRTRAGCARWRSRSARRRRRGRGRAARSRAGARGRGRRGGPRGRAARWRRCRRSALPSASRGRSGSYGGRGGPNTSTNRDEYERRPGRGSRSSSRSSANAPSGVGRRIARTCSANRGFPYAARPITLYSSSFTAKPR